MLPRMIFYTYKTRALWAKKTSNKAYWSYRTALFYAHQLGYFREGKTPLQYAQYLDGKLGTGFAGFMIPYLKLKYAGQQLTPAEEGELHQFLKPFLEKVKEKVSFKIRFGRFFYVLRAIAFYTAASKKEEA